MSLIASWMVLLLAIGSEVAGTTLMKLSDGFSKPLPSVSMFIGYGIALGALTLATKRIEIGVAYAVWSGIGTALIATIGIAFFDESLSSTKVVSLLLIVAGTIGLNISTHH